MFIQGNHYNWFSKDGGTRSKDDDGKNAITFCMEFYGWSFQKAVEELTGFVPDPTADYMAYKSYKPQKPSESVTGRVYDNSPKRVIAYLNQRRKIDYQLIREIIKSGKLKQDDRGNCCFIVNDFTGGYVCDLLRGTATPQGDNSDFKAFKGQSAPQYDFGFTYGNQTNPAYLIFFEAPIDLLSFVQLVKSHSALAKIYGRRGYIPDYRNAEFLERSLLIAMGGRKHEVCRNYAQHYPDAYTILAVDNDEAGDKFADLILHQYRDEVRYGGRYIPELKDWNELLVRRTEKDN